MAASIKQEMPPKGGYGPIDWKQRIPRALSGTRILLGATAFWGLCVAKKLYFNEIYLSENREMSDSRTAMWPFLLAEEQRLEIRRWRENRDYENELMKDVDGWVTGTFFGEKVYVDDERCYSPSGIEFYAHNKASTYNHHFYKRLQRF
ncbi:NADH dehydrogenase [ubiquinone] 1 alpha subcomplex subunit 13-like [Mizuhopecten yessoensis]|nr:NADH dehydrogenase [ubiquinone] 1 alpha subcomplex subunit 13-like [Mizuhopecten yessoensis]